ncbi:MAG: hypothetical protein A3G41_06055 [Elusimicrobia bacterium RIFCSPLOWO2_12_FULL_59_9]|nr:MAG: hypothetical protein A3G41_06055 [Elusimicrobia bacterium RIFCSPLOWO2_12_FULL_59_9]
MKVMAQPIDKLDHAGHRKRLRDRLLRAGAQGFEDYELVELLLTFAISRQDVKPMAKQLIGRFGDLKKVLDAQPEDLARVKGIGPQTAAFLKALRVTMQRYFELAAMQTARILNSTDAVLAYCRASLEVEPREVFEVLYVSSKNRLIKAERLSSGTIDRAAVYPREVIKKALEANAAAFICVHNHPSGDPAPSPEDRKLTEALFEAARAVGITMHDHFIIGSGRHFSFRSQGLLPAGGQKIVV